MPNNLDTHLADAFRDELAAAFPITSLPDADQDALRALADKLLVLVRVGAQVELKTVATQAYSLGLADALRWLADGKSDAGRLTVAVTVAASLEA